MSEPVTSATSTDGCGCRTCNPISSAVLRCPECGGAEFGYTEVRDWPIQPILGKCNRANDHRFLCEHPKPAESMNTDRAVAEWCQANRADRARFSQMTKEEAEAEYAATVRLALERLMSWRMTHGNPADYTRVPVPAGSSPREYDSSAGSVGETGN